TGSLLIETIFSLDGLGRLAYESAIQRDYPEVFGTLYMFGLLGLLAGLISYLCSVLVDPRSDFDRRETCCGSHPSAGGAGRISRRTGGRSGRSGSSSPSSP